MERFGEAATQLFGAASRLLGWRPEEFWEATPTELALALLPADAGSEPPDATTIKDLRQRFPDE
jgi:hypothetical protein